MAQIVLHRRVARYFEHMDPRLKGQLRSKLEELGRDPLNMIDTASNRVVIAHIGPRGDVYK